jgi:chromosome segregation ATPase
MGLNNPDILFPLLEDLSQKVRNLNYFISYTLDDGEQLKNISSDQTSQATFDTNHTVNIKANDGSIIQYWDNEVNSMLDNTNTLVSRITDTESKLKKLLIACNQSITYWNNELRIAQNELSNWKAKLNQAIQGMNAAAIAEQNAIARYRNAESGFYHCRNAKDSQGRPLNRNCSGYQIEMSNAQADINRARQEFLIWKQRKEEAEHQIQLWEARIVKCKDSLSKLSQAKTTTNIGLQSIQEAANFAQRCLEEISSAKILVGKAKEKNAEQEVLANQSLFNIRISQSLSDDSKNSFMSANKLATQVQFYGSAASEEITKRADTLKEFSITPNTL